MRKITGLTGAAIVLSVALSAVALVAGETVEVPEVLHMPASVGDVEFPHRMHVEEFGAECSDCHHSTHAAELDMPHEDYFEDFWIDCKTCHVSGAAPKAEQACSNCHHRNVSRPSDETLSAKVAIHTTCWNCHEVGTGVEASEACGFCHAR